MQVQRFFCLMWGLSLGMILPEVAIAKPHGEMSSAAKEVQTMEQPLAVKAAVTAGGLTLIGLELWWFLLSQPQKKD